ncbi:MAG: hypothetical protein MJE63_29465 [Proteobacteria bacterium]|nr:hypothetical protein [Pseudomonadota bacterium]
MGIILLPIFFVYLLILVISIYRFFLTKQSKKHAWLPTFFILLIPTWDVVLALILFIPSSVFWSGDTINEYIRTDSIYMDIYYDKYGVFDNTKNYYFTDGIHYIEMDVKKGKRMPEKGLHRFWLGEDGHVKSMKIDKIESQYSIKLYPPTKFPLLPLKFKTKAVLDRIDNRIIASSRNVTISFLHIFGFPFFNYLSWSDQGYYSIHSNQNYRYIDEKVINSKK